MMRKCVETPAALLITAISLIVPLTGCASLPSFIAKPRSVPPLRPDPKPASGSSEASKQNILSAVEEFLDRTKEYQLHGSASSSLPNTTPPTALLSTSYAAPRVAISMAYPAPAGLRLEGAGDRAFTNTQVALLDAFPSNPGPALPVIESLSVRALPRQEISAARAVETKTTNQPLDTRSAQDPLTIDQVISNLKTRAAETGDFESEWQLRLTQLAFHRDAEAVKVSPSLAPQTQALFVALIRTAVAVRRAVNDPLLVGEIELDRVNELRELLAQRIDLVVTSVTLCRKVVTFGVYEELADEALVAGRTTWAIVYSEIRNFQTEQTDDGGYRTRLATRLEVLTEDGRSVWQHEEPEIADVCRQRRTDFFIAQRVELPPTLPAGNYVLKVMVEDQLSGKAGETSHAFAINSAMSVRAGP